MIAMLFSSIQLDLYLLSYSYYYLASSVSSKVILVVLRNFQLEGMKTIQKIANNEPVE